MNLFDNYVRLGLIALIPVAVSILLFLLGKIHKIHDLPYAVKQIFIGIIFGLIAILGTENGILINGATMNARDAAPLCAGLIFGAPAGIISGLIGGIERWFAVYWGAGTYTRIACTIATSLCGIFAAFLRKFIFNNKIPGSFYGFVSGLVIEVFHLVLVFVTNISDVNQAFNVVKVCSIPMISAVAISVFLAILFVNLINKKETIDKYKDSSISRVFQTRLLILVIISYLVTSSFTFILQNNTSDTDCDDMLSSNVKDVINDIFETSNRNLLSITRNITNELISIKDTIDNDFLDMLCAKYNVSEINLIGSDGVIYISTNPDFLGFDMNSGDQSISFLDNLKTSKTYEYVQDYGPITYNPSESRKYAGKSFGVDKYVQVGYDAEHFQKDISDDVSYVADNRRVGKNGYIIVVDLSGNVVSTSNSHLANKNIEKLALMNDVYDSSKENIRQESIIDNDDVYYMYSRAEGYYVISIIPVSEINFSRDISIYLNSFMQVLVYAGLFILTSLIVEKKIVKNMVDVDNSLRDITNGQLNTVVNVNETKEFRYLSKGINSTVDRLKDYIKEANERIDAELKYAADIQRNALPSYFPPFRDLVDNIDIYALMNPAKEVGGDFYDFYVVDNHYLVFLVSDVSGKGIPASLFMMRAKTLLKSYAEYKIAVNDIFTNANYNLCEGNDAGMFVTSWMGILDLNNGQLTYANAGHNPPLIKRKNGSYEYLRSKAGFVLGGMEGVVYKLQETTLMPGDEIFVYTDGVTEATNIDKELFGEERLIDSINKHSSLDSESMIKEVKKDVDIFYDKAPQFDDITMLSLKIKKLLKSNDYMEKEFDAVVENLDNVLEFVETILRDNDASAKTIMNMNISLEEMFVNICHYAYPSGAGKALIRSSIDDDIITIELVDNGIPFNPLAKDDPDITKNAEERDIGGLGIFMVKKYMDKCEYERINDQNIFRMYKKIK